MDPVYYPDAYATILRGVVGPISLIGVFASPLGWILAGVAIWRRLPQAFAILARWFVAVHGAAGTLLLFGLVSALSSGQSLAENAWGLAFLAASVSGLLSWIIVGRRSRREERLPSLL
ncbi:MAG TPA: hypothetical protein VGS22_17850 [Thermoanaerobaculia bacterium]|jgi:hypothetical protein|nr:hypothetical protein [Thermoanaerobaculia bacterium]